MPVPALAPERVVAGVFRFDALLRVDPVLGVGGVLRESNAGAAEENDCRKQDKPISGLWHFRLPVFDVGH